MARKTDDENAPKYTIEELQTIVSAGMSVTDARMLLDDGYAPEMVLDLAERQETRRRATAQPVTVEMQRDPIPENKVHPGKSAASYPEGDVKRPRPPLPCQVWWNGDPLHKFPEILHWRELELLAKLQPGDYTVLLKTLDQLPVSVTADRDGRGTVTALRVKFAVTKENKTNIPAMMVVLSQLVHPDNPRQAFMDATAEYLNLMVPASALA